MFTFLIRPTLPLLMALYSPPLYALSPAGPVCRQIETKFEQAARLFNGLGSEGVELTQEDIELYWMCQDLDLGSGISSPPLYNSSPAIVISPVFQ